ncbi:hypothetical protein ACLKA6_001027, partial [Drosophila palustris]
MHSSDQLLKGGNDFNTSSAELISSSDDDDDDDDDDDIFGSSLVNLALFLFELAATRFLDTCCLITKATRNGTSSSNSNSNSNLFAI